VRIYTDEQDGDRALKPFLRRLTKEWEFIARGETSQDRYHQWRCAFYLGKSRDRSVYALQIVDFGDPDNRDYSEDEEDEGSEGFEKVVAVCHDPGTDDEDLIVRQLLSTYWKQGGKYIEGYDDIGRFDLGDLL
jgi:hypothetical protein